MKFLPLLFAMILTLSLGGCASMPSNYEQAKVDVVGISKSATDTAVLQFTIQLRIVNPNPEPIELKGLYYELSIDGIHVVNGTSNQIPSIEGYSDTVVSVSSAANLVNSVRLAARLMESTSTELPYQLRAKLGTTSKWMPATTVAESGVLPLY
ncbi:LEA type 2 family protein [Coraliomargarita sp. SDUM461003]|uniref:LEA type 2 family protein n=1 Tax=Thalassobacterium maritimum TaxID=3041265 RepID=A0ABU1AQ46_9BACT|nr:LEA type 2 family protein [Coraliomargarita sp. SDUM461003]MDQ8206163.1 LEA type 2 family protein [Coraliomargarita sp. SDUM461003]